MSHDLSHIVSLYTSAFHTAPTSTQQITGSGSSRHYYRLSDAVNTAIAVVGTSREENRAFIGLTRHFESKHLPVPHILAVSDDGMTYLQTDLGTTSLYDALAGGRTNGGRYSDAECALLHRTIALLPAMQVLGAEGLDTTLCYPTPAMDATAIHFDLNYFKYCFLKLIPSIDFNEIRLEDDFNNICTDILAISQRSQAIILRDCQARNVMLMGDTQQPCFIDYQGCRLGPVEYDLASFLWQSSSRFPQQLRDELTTTLIVALRQLRPETHPDDVRTNLRLMVLFRIMQVLGTYGFRGYIEHKQYFIQSIPQAIGNLREVIVHGTCDAYPYLKDILTQVVDAIQAQEKVKRHTATPVQPTEGAQPLTVTIYSFSYKKGIPADPSGNGGGYVIACRSTHNPGRYEAYKKLTGLDAPVIQFLEDDGEITVFLSHIYPLVEQHVARYVQRGFSSLMLSFGCTGGQHRSVYCAQHVAERLHALFPQIRIHLIHRERGIDTVL